MCVCVCVCVCVRVCVCVCVRACRNVNQIKTPLINSKIKLTCQCYFCTYIGQQYWATKLSKFTTNLPKLYILIGGYKHTHVRLFANKLKYRVQVAVFIFINRVKQQCQHGMRLRQKP